MSARVRVGFWTVRATVLASIQVRRRQVLDVSLPPPPRTADATAAAGNVRSVLRLLRTRCLVRSLVLQRWFAGHGVRRDVIVGVTAPSRGFRAHAWLDGDTAHEAAAYTALVRRSPTDREVALPAR